jgi:signal transduction histidine kinase
VSAEARARLFEPYFTTKSADRGTGLGLVICRELARSVGGTVDLCEVDAVTGLPPWPRPLRTLVRLSLPALPGPRASGTEGEETVHPKA